jgi:hypothetical protein
MAQVRAGQTRESEIVWSSEEEEEEEGAAAAGGGSGHKDMAA